MNIKSKIKVGGISTNHNQTALTLKSKVKAGGFVDNHNQTALPIKSTVKAGGLSTINHNQTAR